MTHSPDRHFHRSGFSLQPDIRAPGADGDDGADHFYGLFTVWFGPRGLASIVLGMVYLEQEVHLPGEDTIRLTVMATVMLSIFERGFSALPGIGLYSKKNAALAAGAPEHQEVGIDLAVK